MQNINFAGLTGVHLAVHNVIYKWRAQSESAAEGSSNETGKTDIPDSDEADMDSIDSGRMKSENFDAEVFVFTTAKAVAEISNT